MKYCRNTVLARKKPCQSIQGPSDPSTSGTGHVVICGEGDAEVCRQATLTKVILLKAGILPT